MSNVQHQYLDALGITRWVIRAPAVNPIIETSALIEPAVETKAGGAALMHSAAARGLNKTSAPQKKPALVSRDLSAFDWTALRENIAQCGLCDLSNSRKQTVFGVGNQQADWLVVGEAPGPDEDAQGEPFVNRINGQLLDAMLLAIGLPRAQVYMTNSLKCKPPNNRDAKADEAACCKPYLLQQINLLQPKIILAIGRIPAQQLLQTDTPLERLRGQVHTLSEFGIPVIATYHPDHLLRKPIAKRKAWDDLKLALSVYKQAQ
ncbi:MAG: uracil-DNA glycosylase [Gammaproteobacteria bacterium]|nr:uracil-DNA glycosylase [Gammaproteobacteria bacterium]